MDVRRQPARRWVVSRWVVGLALLAAAGPSWAGTVIDVGTHYVLPNTADQVIVLQARSVGPTDAVTGFNLRAQIGDGLGEQPEPIFSSIDFGGESVWSGQEVTILGGPVGDAPQFAQASVVLNESGAVASSEGMIARLHIDTTGITEGDFPLLLEGTQIGLPSVFIASGGADLVPSIKNGILRVWQDVCGDFDRDGDVDSVDQATLILNWTGALPAGEGEATFEQGDCDADGDVDSVDFTSLILEWTGVRADGPPATLHYDPAMGEVEVGSSSDSASALSSIPLAMGPQPGRPALEQPASGGDVAPHLVEPLRSSFALSELVLSATVQRDAGAAAGREVGGVQAVVAVPEPTWGGGLGWLLAWLLVPCFRRPAKVKRAPATAAR